MRDYTKRDRDDYCRYIRDRNKLTAREINIKPISVAVSCADEQTLNTAAQQIGVYAKNVKREHMPSKHPTETSPEWSCGCGEKGTGKESFKEHAKTCILHEH